MTSLFESMARHRPEWLAQGLLMRAVATEPDVRALLLEGLQRGQVISKDEVPGVTEEEVTESGWRADVCVTWVGYKARIELKLLAGFTRRQEEALLLRKVDLLVLPEKGDRELPKHLSLLTWEEIAGVVSDPYLKKLLGEVSVSSTWSLKDISGSELDEDFNSFLGEHDKRNWARMYRFLSTVHLHLLEDAPTEYRASDGWTRARTNQEPYYGFCFWLGADDTPRFWLGFWRSPPMGKPVFELSVASKRRHPLLLLESERFSAGELARQVLSKAREHVNEGP